MYIPRKEFCFGQDSVSGLVQNSNRIPSKLLPYTIESCCFNVILLRLSSNISLQKYLLEYELVLSLVLEEMRGLCLRWAIVC